MMRKLWENYGKLREKYRKKIENDEKMMAK
jgi:hypothetical protein